GRGTVRLRRVRVSALLQECGHELAVPLLGRLDNACGGCVQGGSSTDADDRQSDHGCVPAWLNAHSRLRVGSKLVRATPTRHNPSQISTRAYDVNPIIP